MIAMLRNLRASAQTAGMFHLMVVYIVWSSTYLAIRIAVGETGGFPPFFMGASRMIVAGLILLIIAKLGKHRIKLTRSEIRVLILSSLALWVGGNGLVMLAEQNAASGFAALMVSASPIWAAAMEWFIDRKRPSFLLLGCLLLGFFGVAVLMTPSLLSNSSTSIMAGIVLVLGSISWSAGSVYQTRRPVALAASVMSAYQHLFACLGFLLLAIITGEPWPTPSISAWIAWGYLIVFGSVLAFTSYVLTLRLLPLDIAMTYAYVNPVLALILGWWLLDETITSWTAAGAAMVVIGVVGVFKHKFQGNAKSLS